MEGWLFGLYLIPGTIYVLWFMRQKRHMWKTISKMSWGLGLVTVLTVLLLWWVVMIAFLIKEKREKSLEL